MTSFTADELAEVVDDLASRPRVADRLAVPGLDPRRADIILGGVIVLEQVVKALGIGELVISDFALREGVLLDVVRRRQAGTLGHLRDLRYESVLHLAALVPGEKEHCDRITALAAQLFEGTKHLSGLSDGGGGVAGGGAILQNVGLVISHDRHHLHSYYVIRNSELLTGFTEHELEIIALVARYHRKSTPKARHPEYAALHESDQRVVEILSGVLRIAAGLDRTRCGAISRLRVEGGVKGQPLRILVETAPGVDADLELYSAQNRKDLLEEALGVTVAIEAVPPGLLKPHGDTLKKLRKQTVKRMGAAQRVCRPPRNCSEERYLACLFSPQNVFSSGWATGLAVGDEGVERPPCRPCTAGHSPPGSRRATGPDWRRRPRGEEQKRRSLLRTSR